MKKVLFIGLIILMTIVGLYQANTYTSAMAENNVSISITNPHGMLALIPEGQIMITPGDSKAALTLTNNMAFQIMYSLEYSADGLDLSPLSGTLTPGSSHEFYLSVSESTPAGYRSLSVTLLADFNGGRARVHTAVPLQIIAAPPAVNLIPEGEEQQLDSAETAGQNDDNHNSESNDMDPGAGSNPAEEAANGNKPEP